MGKSRRLLCGTVLCLLLAPARVVAAPLNITVDGPSPPREFYIIARPTMNNLIVRYRTETAAIGKIESAVGVYGPAAIGRGLPLDPREDYLVFPRCNGRLKPPGEPVSGRLGRVRLRCR